MPHSLLSLRLAVLLSGGYYFTVQIHHLTDMWYVYTLVTILHTAAIAITNGPTNRLPINEELLFEMLAAYEICVLSSNFVF